MTPVRVHGGGLSGVRSGGVYAVRVFGRHKWRPYVFAAGWGCGGVFIAFALFRCCYAVPVFGRHKWRPYVFCGGTGVAVVSLLRCVVPVVFAPFGCSGVINGAPTFLRRDGVRWCLYCVCAVWVFGRHKWRPYVFLWRDGNSCRPGCRSCRFDCFSWRCACPWMRCGGCFSVAVWKNCRFENNFHWKLCRLKSCLYLCRRNP